LFATDILKVLYAPHKVFKQIIQSPKYWGPILVFVIFIALQSGFYYNLYSKTYYEQTSPQINQLGTWTEDSTLWTVTPGVTITSNYLDFLNSSFYGNSSMQFDISNSGNLSLALTTISNVDCGPTGFQDLSMRTKQISPETTPSRVTLTLYSISSSNSYQRDLTSEFSNASLIGVWNNITIPVGSNATNWQTVGTPQWTNVTGLKLDFTYSSNSSISMRMEGLFFRGEFKTPVQSDFTGFLLYILQLVVTQFLFQWLLFTGLVYVIIKGLKGTVIWKPLFVAVGFALAVTIVQSLINNVSILTLPAVNYPAELLTNLPGEAQILTNAVSAQTATYSLIASIIQLAIYVWIVGLGAIIVHDLQPEFKWNKAILTSAAAFIVTIIVISLLGV
jgi:hypothetical protein